MAASSSIWCLAAAAAAVFQMRMSFACIVVDTDGDSWDLSALAGITEASGPGPTSCTLYPNCDW